MKYNVTFKMFKQSGLPPNEQSMYAFAIITGILVTLGLCGNLLTMVVIIWSPRLKSVFNYLIVSLCASNLVSALVSIIKTHCLTWGLYSPVNIKMLCGVSQKISNWMTINIALHITVFAFLRFISITWVSAYHKITLFRLKVFVVIAWLVSGLVGFAFGWLRKMRKTRMTMNSVIHITFIVLMLIFCAATVVMILSHRQRRQSIGGTNRRSVVKKRDKDIHKVLQIVLIVGSYIFGYLPCVVYNLSTLEKVKKDEVHSRWTFAVVQYICLRISECLNPMFYNVSSRKLWRETQRLLGIKLSQDYSTSFRSKDFGESRKSEDSTRLKVEITAA